MQSFNIFAVTTRIINMTETYENNSESIICGRCKAQLPPGMMKCPCCGWRVENIPVEPVDKPSENDSGANVCGRCKAQLPPGMMKCPCCGWKRPELVEVREYDLNESITCKSCKAQLPPGVLTCPCCGWKAVKDEDESDKPGVFVVLLVVLLIVLLIILVFTRFFG